MRKVECGEWRLEVDVDATRAAYTSIARGDPESCGCIYCRNFTSARERAYPEEVRRFYSQFGISVDREAETYEAGRVEEGRHRYGGWHHFIGRIIQGADAGLEIAPGFSVSFQESKSCAEPAFHDVPAVVQIEFFTVLPWVLEEQPESE